MFHFLLTIEHLAVLLLFWTWLLAATANRSWRLRLPVQGTVFLLLLGWTGLLAGGWIFLATLYPLRATAIATPLLLFVGFFIGSIAIWIRARRSGDDPLGASDWPARRIALVLAIAVGVHFVTWANLDAAVQKEIAALRAEAYHMAESVAPPQVPDRENAAPHYMEVFDSWGLIEWPKEFPAWVDGNFDEIDVQSKETQAFLASKRHFIDRLRHAAAIPQCRFEHEYYRPAPDILLPEIQNLRDASRLLSLDARAHFSAGRIEEATRNIDAMWSMADHAASQPFVISFLVGLAIERQAIATVEAGMGEGKWKDRKLPKLAMETGGIAARLRLHRALAFEECMGILMCCDAAQGQGAVWEPNTGLGNRAAGMLFTTAYRIYPFFAQDVALYRQKMRRLRQYAEMLPARLAGGEFKIERKDVQALGLIPKLMLPMQEQLILKALQAEIPRETVRLGIQTFRYELQYGKSPSRLQDLVPEFIPAVPRDPYGQGPYRFIPAKDGQTWSVYSIGPDGVDNSGTRIESGDSGDIVVSPRKKKD